MSSALLQTDGYKLFHKAAYHPDITKVYSNYTSRSGKLSNVPNNGEVVFVGLQYFIKEVLIDEWNTTFFNLSKKEAIKSFKRIVDNYLGMDYNSSHIEDLHDLGYLPISIKALSEGVVVPYGVPPVTFVNTVDGFQWLTNYIETVFSTENWPIQTSATTSRAYLKNTIKAFDNAGLPHDMVPFMCHDFSMRGMFGRQAAAMSGFGHLTSFYGTDTLPAVMFAEKYYNADVEKGVVGCSVPATEHSTATSYILSLCEEEGTSKFEAELEYVRYLMNIVPEGIVSHVSDSFDFWKFISEGLPLLKDEIIAREGRLVVRPDTGNPVKVLTGYRVLDTSNCSDYEIEYALEDLWNEGYEAIKHVDGLIRELCTKSLMGYPEVFIGEVITEAESKGLVESLYETFGGSESPTGLKLLDDHIGAIYGDSITLQRQEEIISRLEAKGFAAMVVLGVGSYSYQHVTRDTHGSAVKATWVEKSGKGVNVKKDPLTDSKKKSAEGLLRVELEDGKYTLYDKQTLEQETQGELQTVFKNGELLVEHSLEDIRKRIREGL